MTQEGAQPNPSEMIYLAEKWSSHAQEYRSYRVQCGTRLDIICGEWHCPTQETYDVPYRERSKAEKVFIFRH